MTPSGFATGYATPAATAYWPGSTPPGVAAGSGYATGYACAFATAYWPGAPILVPSPPYRAPSPTGWKSTGRRRGPDPNFSSGARVAGQGW